ncbi:orotate phosphoribosyltransferase [Cesiribacter andamanensis]|uniref:Orotate phosphoribosyltransferase n=1 Tax=Cesiribacter andamanensis AMV16 TaxID=1279009 RepID=M7NLN9_9BACT|nr:orotate phosphoribosyltransferase [Cesiribacter andamanensis]EMR02695.1 Orotate phosphoribosyltransferase [Cesiribacter andamanensis AMV16]
MSLAEDPSQLSRQTARQLLQIGAIRLRPEQPFTWASGWKSPIYCDNRLSLSFPEVRLFIKRALSELVTRSHPHVEAIAGVATAGIPQGALVADSLNLPFAYVRSSPKGHGMENLIEGHLPQGRKVVVLEDLISTGGSSLKAAQALREHGCQVLGMVSIFTYGFDVAEQNFAAAGLPLHSLSNYQSLIEEAQEMGLIGAAELESLQEWRRQPDRWKQG